MRCTRITFEGFKRLADTDCNVSPRLLAFVGQNEAGKSSVLTGLEWLTEDEDEATPLPELDKSRSKKKKSGWVVGAIYSLSDDDQALLRPLGFEHVPKKFALWKQVDGSLVTSFHDGKDPKRDPAAFGVAAAALEQCRTRLAKQFAAQSEGDEDQPVTWATTLTTLLADPEATWSPEDKAAADALAAWLETPPPSGKNPRDEKTARLIREAATIGSAEHPNDVGRRLMRERAPKFVLFRDEDRDLPTVSAIDPASRPNLRPAIRNILTVSGISATALWNARTSGDSGEVQTLLSNGNLRLDAFFGQAWNQSNVSVRLDLDENGLSTHIFEIDTGRFTRIEERSDGLRAFVALAAFLEAQDLDVPPILLIDEAETHLHLDAQADLVGVLLKQVNATQVYYTTHSPGCLPSDLGTGIRLLARNGSVSEIKSHFWTNETPGFAPLLFAMGASAAAFSVCRRAVLAEGGSDMVLLPTLLRVANGLDDIDYQIAPGLSNARAFDMDVEDVAARVVYLTDGDKAGAQYKRDLMKLAHVPDERVFALPDGFATEDLLERQFYLDVVISCLPDDAPRPDLKSISKTKPIGTALSDWAAKQDPPLHIPGKVAIAYEVIERDVIKLEPEGRQALIDLHHAFVAAFAHNSKQGAER